MGTEPPVRQDDSNGPRQGITAWRGASTTYARQPEYAGPCAGLSGGGHEDVVLFAEIPRGLQNLVEWAYETLADFGTSIGGPEAARYIPIYAAFFLLILFSNWSGLVPPVGKLEELRAPTSDVNITIGLAISAFAFFAPSPKLYISTPQPTEQ